MGKSERARAVVAAEYEFRAATALTPTAVVEVADGIASRIGGQIAGSMSLARRVNKDTAHVAEFHVAGPVKRLAPMIARVIVIASASSNGTRVELTVPEFLFQGGSLGTRPTINGGKLIMRFVDALKAELAAA